MTTRTAPGDDLYEDRLVKLSGETIRFACYYFPFGARQVPLENIERIDIVPAGLGTGSWRIWGTGDFLTWFPCDWARPSRKVIYLLRERGKCRRIGFTVEDDEQFQCALTAASVPLQERPAEETARQSREALLAFAGIVLLLVGSLSMVTAVPLIAGWVAPNPTYGVRTARTFSDPRIWYSVNRFGGMVWAGLGVLFDVGGVMLILKRRAWPMWVAVTALIMMPVAVLLSVAVVLAYASAP